jgi:hypothetical protein
VIQVKNGKLVRVNRTKTGAFDRDPKSIAKLELGLT